MGCTQSKIDKEETVTRCKDRKYHMKEAVSARNAFAAAHSLYTMALKNTGAALSDYANGEFQFSTATSAPLAGTGIPAVSQPSYDSLPPPPPPLPNFPANPLQRAATMPEFSIPKPDPRSDPIIEEGDEEEDDDEEEEVFYEESGHDLKHRSTRSAGAGGGGGGGKSGVELPVNAPVGRNREPPPPPSPEMNGMSWDFFFAPMENVPNPSLAEVDEGRIEREEMERKALEERARMAAAAEAERKAKEAAAAAAEKAAKEREKERERELELPPQPPPPEAAAKVIKKVRHVAAPMDGKRSGKGGGGLNLLQVFSDIDDCFLKAFESAHEVSKMLEANRLHYHSNFADNRGHIDHSARVMRVITWNRSFRGLINTEEKDDDFDSEENETHATVLDKMLAWEKKLYDEVKAGEQMKLDYQKKVASLNKLKKRGASTESLERAKAAVSRLHTRYIVDMQSMDSTVSEINRLRDEQLYPKLVALVDGMATMWETMQMHHQSQSRIVQALGSLFISEEAAKETSDHHHERTVQLWGVCQEWHLQFEKLMGQQKRYIKELSNWLRINLIPIDNNLREKVSSPQRPQNPPIQHLLHVWHDHLDKLPEELARTAIYNFAAVVNTIMQYQEEEMKQRDRCEDTRKELSRKQQQLEDWYNKQMQRRTGPDEMDADSGIDKDHIAERQFAVDVVKKRLEDEEEEYRKLCIQVRDKSLTSLKTRLPELFRSMTEFSYSCSEMYRDLRSVSISRNINEIS
ncbi:nitrate regulatory gene2 protein [Apium graveolens]|uniref:nitrate regulatory gene2 protein n=1 Tax=Apium graveolens TaxID=4045 RepID=UPI003D7A6E02